MRSNKLIPTLIIIIFLLTFFQPKFTAISTDTKKFRIIQGDWGYPDAHFEAAPGDERVPLTVEMQYINNQPAYNLIANLSLPSGFKNITNGGYALAFYSSINPHVIFYLTFTINILKKANLGKHIFTLNLTWEDEAGKHIEMHEVKIYLKGRVSLLFESKNKKLKLGKVNDYSISIKNVGSGDAKDVKVTLNTPPQVSLLTSQPISIEKLSSGQSSIIHYKIYVSPMAASLPLTFIVIATYTNAYGYKKSIQQNIGVYVTGVQLPLLHAYITPKNITSGYLTTVNMTIENQGEVIARNLTISITTQPPLVIINGDGKWYLGNLKSKSSYSLNIKLYSSPIDNTITSQLIISFDYLDSSGLQRVETRTITLTILPKIERPLLKLEIKPNEFSIGKYSSIQIKVINTGIETLRDINIKVMMPQGYSPIIFLNSYGEWKIEELKKHEIVIINETIKVGSSAGIYNIPITVSYRDEYEYLHVRHLIFGLIINPLDKILIDILSINPNEIISGRTSNLYLKFKNVGKDKVRDLSVLITTTQPVILIDNDNNWYLGSMDPGETKIINLTIQTPPLDSTSLIQLTVIFQYRDAAGIFNTESRTLGLILKPAPEIRRLELKVDPQRVTAGLTQSLKLVISNKGIVNLKDIKIEILYNQVLPFILLDSDGKWFIDALPPDKEAAITINAKVTDVIGAYNIAFKLVYKDSVGYKYEEVKLIGISVDLPPVPMIIIKTLGGSLIGGQNNTITLNIKNEGQVAIRELSLTINTQGQIILLNVDNKIYIGNLNPGDVTEVNVTFYAPPVTSKTSYQMNILLNYYDELGRLKQESRVIGFIVEPIETLSPLKVIITPTELISGKLNNLTITFINLGPGFISDLSASITPGLPQLIIMSSNILQFKLIKEGASISQMLQIYVQSPAPTTAQLKVSINYLDRRGSRVSEVRTLGLLLRGIVDLRITDYSIVPEKVKPGQPFSITITVINTGTTTAGAVIAIAHIDKSLFRIIGAPSVFVGDVPINAPTTFTINLFVLNTTKPGDYIIRIELNYTDNLRSAWTYQTSLTISIIKEESISVAKKTYPLGIENIVLIVILLSTVSIGYLLYKKRRRR